MKIAILTFHCAHNYGAVLQAYALCKQLESMGNTVEFIDYRPSYLTNRNKAFSFARCVDSTIANVLKNIVKEIVFLPEKLRKNKKFDLFSDTYLTKTTEKYKEYDVMPKGYDVYIIGSDQVWNYREEYAFDEIFFGFFDGGSNAKKVSYAASLTTLNYKMQDFYRVAMKNFDHISVREQNIQTFLQNSTSQKIYHVLDPTLIVENSVWERIAVKPTINKKYVLIYQVRQTKRARVVATKIAKELGAIVVEIGDSFMNKNIVKLKSESPQEFVGLFKHASFIITTSFHGTALAIIFKNQFYFISPGKEVGNRSKSLLKELGLESRYISADSVSVPLLNNEVDFNLPLEKLAILKNSSRKFLKRSLD